jgi:hypothetical protein
MIVQPSGLGMFEFTVLSGLRAAQLIQGCTPRVVTAHKHTVTAQLEVAGGKVVGATRLPTASFIDPRDRQLVAVEMRQAPTALKNGRVTSASV